MAFSRTRRREFWKRKSARYSRLGREQEALVAKILLDAEEDGEPLFLDAGQYEANSTEDAAGKDIWVTRKTGKEAVMRSFGISISRRKWLLAKARHHPVPQFCFPIGVKTETVISRVLELFETKEG